MCVHLRECRVVTSRVVHRFPAISAKPLIRHLAFSLVLDYSLCELPLPSQLLEGVCVFLSECVRLYLLFRIHM